jgi:hypothetical protein
MGVFFEIGFPMTESHEGYGARRLPSGKLTSGWTHETRGFTGYVAACDCGWVGETDHVPNEAGQKAAIDEWREKHIEPLLPGLARKAARCRARDVVSGYRDEAVDGVPKSRSSSRALVMVAALQALTDEAESRVAAEVDAARRAGVSWSAIGDALGVSRQAAHERFANAGE